MLDFGFETLLSCCTVPNTAAGWFPHGPSPDLSGLCKGHIVRLIQVVLPWHPWQVLLRRGVSGEAKERNQRCDTRNLCS